MQTSAIRLLFSTLLPPLPDLWQKSAEKILPLSPSLNCQPRLQGSASRETSNPVMTPSFKRRSSAHLQGCGLHGCSIVLILKSCLASRIKTFLCMKMRRLQYTREWMHAIPIPPPLLPAVVAAAVTATTSICQVLMRILEDGTKKKRKLPLKYATRTP